MIEASEASVGRRVGVLLAAVAVVAASLVTVIGAPPAGAAGPPHHLAFTTSPGGGVAGAAWASQPVVAIQDIPARLLLRLRALHAAESPKRTSMNATTGPRRQMM